jgi:chemotaxis protein methyltransferase CheR
MSGDGPMRAAGSEEARPPGFRRIIRHIEDEVDFEPSHYNPAYLDRRITARMRRRRADTYDEYLAMLKASRDEEVELLDALTVNVTHFFRNPEMWAAVRPLLRELSSSRRTVRLWSAPCADGREPYSMAMLARDDDEIDHRRVEIVATDIDREALERARRGVYQTGRTTKIAEELSSIGDYAPYVTERDGEFAVAERIRRMVSFERHDLIGDEPKSDVDLLMCRNLLIYIDPSFKRTIFESLATSLREGGYLVIGMTETVPPECRELFEPVDKRRRIYRRTNRRVPRRDAGVPTRRARDGRRGARGARRVRR